MKSNNTSKTRYREDNDGTREKTNNFRIDKKFNHNYPQQMYDKHKHQARDALSSGDRTLAEYHYQYAEHFFRIINEKSNNVEKQSPVSELPLQGEKGESRPVYTKNARRYPTGANASIKRKESAIFPVSLCESTTG